MVLMQLTLLAAVAVEEVHQILHQNQLVEVMVVPES
jgi:hypothetical protein